MAGKQRGSSPCGAGSFSRGRRRGEGLRPEERPGPTVDEPARDWTRNPANGLFRGKESDGLRVTVCACACVLTCMAAPLGARSQERTSARGETLFIWVNEGVNQNKDPSGQQPSRRSCPPLLPPTCTSVHPGL